MIDIASIESSIMSSYERSDRVMVIKIVNYEVLLSLLEANALSTIMKKFEQIVLNTLKTDNFKCKLHIYQQQYLFIIIDGNQSKDFNRLSYSIYKNLQLYNAKDHKHAIFECKITSAPFADGIVRNLLLCLATSSAVNYFCAFDSTIHKKVTNHYSSLSSFQHALQNHNIFFAYQPIVDRITGHISHHECLLRVQNKSTDVISAGPLISMAEQVGLNNIIDQIVLTMAVEELMAAPNITLSANISNAGILDPNLLDLASSLLMDKSIASRMIIEITETSVNNDFKKTEEFIAAIRKLGCQIALDDFGSGNTSFKQLQSLHIDIIKIDGSFIKDIAYNALSQHLVIALVDIAKQLGAKTVAEFVEDGVIAKFLLEAKIDYMQGNFFSPAINHRAWDKA